MIERKFVSEKLKEFLIKEHINKKLKNAGQSDVKLKKTPLGEKIIVSASRPGMVVGRKGENIKLLTKELKKEFKLENPQIEIEEITNPVLDPHVMAEKIATTLERFGSARFKSVGHKVLEEVIRAGALGVEILISGKIPSSRAKTWRFYQGYLKKSGSIAKDGVLTAYAAANLKTGTVGVQVRIMPANVELPDKVVFKTIVEEVAEVTEEVKEALEEAIEKKTTKKATKKKATKKTVKKTTKKAKEEVKADKKSEAVVEDKAPEEKTEEPKKVEEVKTEEVKEDKKESPVEESTEDKKESPVEESTEDSSEEPEVVEDDIEVVEESKEDTAEKPAKE